MADQAVQIGVEARRGNDHIGRDGGAVGQYHPLGFECRDRGHHVDPARPYDVDQFVGQRGDSATLFHGRLQSEWRPTEAVRPKHRQAADD